MKKIIVTYVVLFFNITLAFSFSPLLGDAVVINNKNYYLVEVSIYNPNDVDVFIAYPIGFDYKKDSVFYYFNRDKKQKKNNNIFVFYTTLPNNSSNDRYFEETSLKLNYQYEAIKCYERKRFLFFIKKKYTIKGKAVFIFNYSYTDIAFSSVSQYAKNVFCLSVLTKFY